MLHLSGFLPCWQEDHETRLQLGDLPPTFLLSLQFLLATERRSRQPTIPLLLRFQPLRNSGDSSYRVWVTEIGQNRHRAIFDFLHFKYPTGC